MLLLQELCPCHLGPVQGVQGGERWKGRHRPDGWDFRPRGYGRKRRQGLQRSPVAIAHPSDGVTAEIAQVPLSELTERTSVTTVDVGPVDEGDGTPGEVEENVGV